MKIYYIHMCTAFIYFNHLHLFFHSPPTQTLDSTLRLLHLQIRKIGFQQRCLWILGSTKTADSNNQRTGRSAIRDQKHTSESKHKKQLNQ